MNAIILAAGKQTRFFDNTRKSLVLIDKKISLIEHNIKCLLSEGISNVFVVCQQEFKNDFEFLKSENVQVIPICGGNGCGGDLHDVLMTLKIDDYVLLWGDTYINDKKVVSILIEEYKGEMLVPVVFEEHPYVRIITEGDEIVGAQYAKYGKVTGSGFHDLSIFAFNSDIILSYLSRLFRYAPGETDFLDIFNIRERMQARVLKNPRFNEKTTQSFNTVQEYDTIKREVNKCQ